MQFEVFTRHLLQAKLCTHAGQSLIEVDRFCDVVNCAGIQTFELIFFRGFRGDENNGDGLSRGICLQMLASFDAVHFGHHDVE